MTDRSHALESAYLSICRTYLETGDESALSGSYELGRQAMVDGLGVLDMALLHRTAIEALVVPASPGDQARCASMAAKCFDELLSTFEMSFRGYRGANDELQRLNESLRQQKDAVEIANRELESFSYSVAHDLSAPLRRITGFSQILIEDFADALGDEGKTYLKRIHQGAEDLAQLVKDLLTLARANRTEIHRSDVDLTLLARRISERLQAASPDRKGGFAIQDGVHGEGDPQLLGILLENLLGNAWKFTSRSTEARVAFGLEKHKGEPTYFVRDNGAGFDMASASKLFEAFQRLHSEREFEGTGIGLATVQRVIKRHEGRVWAEGKIDAGATFYFTLGLTAMTEVAPQPRHCSAPTAAAHR